jgi:hypothetical protein
MIDATASWSSVLSEMSQAFSDGDNRRGEELLGMALDVGAPWDIATATVALAVARHRGVRQTEPGQLAAPA